MKRQLKWTLLLGGSIGILSAAILVGRAWAGGIPTKAPLMTYSGVLLDATGKPLPSPQIIEVRLWPSATPGTTPLCTSAPKTAPIDDSGRFSIPMDPCVATIRSTPDVWAEVIVGTSSLSTSKLGAVPYALEAAHATTADTATNATNATNATHATSADTATNTANATYSQGSQGNFNVAGTLGVGLHTASGTACSFDTTNKFWVCACAANEVAISGGIYCYDAADGYGILEESHNSGAPGSLTNAWVLTCVASNMARMPGSAPHAICARIGA